MSLQTQLDVSTGSEIAGTMVSGGGNSIERRTIRKLQLRLLPFLFVLYVISFVDRINIGFAALTMNKELAMTSQQFGFAAGIFFFGYFLFEVPSNLLLHKIGARIWIARILITWGILAALTGFVHTVHHLYVLRFLLGTRRSRLLPRHSSVSHILVSASGASEGPRAVHDGLAGHQHRRRSHLRLDPGSRALARRQQLALAAGLGRIARCSFWRSDVLRASESSGGCKIPDFGRKRMAQRKLAAGRKEEARATPLFCWSSSIEPACAVSGCYRTGDRDLFVHSPTNTRTLRSDS